MGGSSGRDHGVLDQVETHLKTITRRSPNAIPMAMEATRGHSSRWLTGVGHFGLFESLIDIPVLLTRRDNVSPDLSLVEIEPPISAQCHDPVTSGGLVLHIGAHRWCGLLGVLPPVGRCGPAGVA